MRDPEASELLAKADALRDSGFAAEASAAYALVLAIDPRLHDVRVQYGNMLKDSGAFGRAEHAYREALTAKPTDPDIHLQLGHALKLQGRIKEAAVAYREAASHGSPHAALELLRDPDASELLAKADALRDSGFAAEASAAYALVLAIDPRLHDVRVQYGNMLKDSGAFGRAEHAYREALTAKPTDPDIHLQLGHALKLQGRIKEAAVAYREAASHGSPHAALELLHIGDASGVAARGYRGLPIDAEAAVTSLAVQVKRLKVALAEVEMRLPSLDLARAFPPDGWPEFRILFPTPTPPVIDSARSVTLVLDAAGQGVRNVVLQVAAIVAQSHPAWRAVFVGADPDARQAIERLAVAETRLALADHLDGALLGVTGTVILCEAGAVFDPRAAAWAAFAAALAPEHGFTADVEYLEEGPSGPAPSRALLRGVTDPETLREVRCAGPLLIAAAASLTAAPGATMPDLIHASALALADGGRLGHVPLPLAGLPRDVDVSALPAAPPRLDVAGTETISVVVATRDNAADVLAFAESLKGTAGRPERFDILVVDNGSTEPASVQILSTMERRRLARIVRLERPFNWSHLNNSAAELASGSILLFANDDMTMTSGGWDDTLRGLLARPGVGAVGARLVYPGGSVQHAGVLSGWNGSVIHDGLDADADEAGPAGRWLRTRRCSAVTGAFLATPARAFRDLRGFDAVSFAVAFGDVDYCFRLREAGLAVLVTPRIEAVHYESKTRGYDHASAAKRDRVEAERLLFQRRWGEAARIDLSVNPLWLAHGRPFRLLRAVNSATIADWIARSAQKDPWRARRDHAPG